MAGAGFRILHPPEMVDLLREWAARFEDAARESRP
jgi:hypothetical protein